MERSQLICIGFAVIMVIAIFVYRLLATKGPTDEEKQKALDFLNGLSDKLLKVMIIKLQTITAGGYMDYVQFSADVIKTLGDTCWDFVEQDIKEIYGDDPSYKSIVKLIDRDSINKIVESIVSSGPVSEKIKSIFDEYLKGVIETMEEEERKAKEEADAYENGTVKVEDYNGEFDEKITPVQEEIIPDTVEYLDTDSTIEILHSDEVIEELSED